MVLLLLLLVLVVVLLLDFMLESIAPSKEFIVERSLHDDDGPEMLLC
jgi:hypothetical protein